MHPGLDGVMFAIAHTRTRSAKARVAWGGSAVSLLLIGLLVMVCVAEATESVARAHHGCAAVTGEPPGASKVPLVPPPGLPPGPPAGPSVWLDALSPSGPSPVDLIGALVPAGLWDDLSPRSPPPHL